MNLAKALKLKNRYAQKIARLQTDIQTNNSVPDGQERKIDVKNLMEQLGVAVNDLIKLKLLVFEASSPIRDTILRLAELKSRISFLKSIDVREGKHYEFGMESEINYTAEFDILWVREGIENCEKQIDEMQDEIDTFNHKTEIELS